MKNKIRIQLIPPAKLNDHGARCNFNCIWCHNDFFGFQAENGIIPATQQIDEIIEGIKTIEPFYNQKLPVQISAAGEPTMIGLNNLIVLIKKLRDRGYDDIGLTTNGSKIYPAYIKKLKEAGLTAINFSINSLNPNIYASITGSSPFTLFKVLSNVEQAASMLPDTSVNCIYSTFNENEIDEILDFLSTRKNITWKFFDLIGQSTYYLPIQNLIDYLEAKGYHFVKKIDSEYIHLSTAVGQSRIKIKISREENSCPNLKCKFREQCTEGCRASIRISAYGIQPCGVKKGNMIPRNKFTDVSFIENQLKEGGKLEISHATAEIV